MRATAPSSISSLKGTKISPVSGSTMSSAAIRPRMRLVRLMPTVRASGRRTTTPWVVPQSSSRMITSWATSISRRVR